MDRKPDIGWDDFAKLDIRVGTVVRAEAFPEARRPAIKLWLNFGEGVGVLKTSAQITARYAPDVLLGRQVVAVVNFPPKQIGSFMSQCLVSGQLNPAVMWFCSVPTNRLLRALPSPRTSCVFKAPLFSKAPTGLCAQRGL